ncbi:hypothetical protein H9X95_01010, partial [Micromonospora chalcea]|uniref:hypothetical protein n=1 Tax=Micromonospora chalcea TaxID=1874 RepID=UPI001656CF22
MPDEPQPTEAWERFPPDQVEAFRRWASISGVSVDIEGYHGGGFSGAPIAMARWHTRGKQPKRGFLRFYRSDTEITRVMRAYDDSPPGFKDDHLPEAEMASLGESWVAMVGVAGGDLLACPPLLEVMGEPEFPAHLRDIVRSLVQDWNQPPPAQSSRETTVGTYLAELLDGWPEQRRSPRQRLMKWAQKDGVSDTQGEIRLSQSRPALPNPLAFISGSQPRSQEKLRLQTGRTHGDLNIGNILVPTEPTLDGSRYQLIDLGSYQTDGPLTRDLMHLLLSIAAQWLRTTTRLGNDQTGADLIRALVRPSRDRAGYRPELSGHAEVSAAVHDAGRDAAASLGFGDPWRVQTLLSLAGCALLFADRDLRMPDEDQARGWFFTLAATALEEYLRLTERQAVAPV